MSWLALSLSFLICITEVVRCLPLLQSTRFIPAVGRLKAHLRPARNTDPCLKTKILKPKPKSECIEQLSVQDSAGVHTCTH